MKIKLLLSIFVLFLWYCLRFLGYSQTQMISISNLKYTNGSAITSGSPIQIVEGGTVSVTFDLGINNPGFALIQGGTLLVYSKLNSNTTLQHVSIYFGQNAISGSVSRQCTIELKSSHFPSGTGSIYAQFSPVNNSPILGTSVPVKTVPLITSNYIIGNQTVYEGDPVGSINGPTPNGGNGLYAYSWQQRIGSAGAWTTIPGANSVTFTPTNVSISTISYRRIVTSLFGTLTSTSNEITVTILPNIPLNNNTITVNGNTISGSLPTGGTGTYEYVWWYGDGAGVEGFILPGNEQNLEVPSWMHNETYEAINASVGLYVSRTVKSGIKSVQSNVVKVPLLPAIENNIITVNGNTISGSLPTGGTGTYEYVWWYGDGAGVEGFILPGNGQNLEVPSWMHNETYEAINASVGLYVSRTVKSGIKSVSNVLKIPLLNSNRMASTSNIQSDLSVEELATVYPNPTSGSINFSTAFSTDKDIEEEITVYSDNLQKSRSVFKGRITPIRL